MTHVRVVKQWKLEKSACDKSHGATLLPSHRRLLLSPLVPSLTMKPLCLDHLSCFTMSLIYCYEIRHPNSLWFRVTTLYYLLMILSFEWGSAGWLFRWSDLGSCVQVLSSGVSNWAGTSRMTPFTSRASAGMAGTAESWLGISLSLSPSFSKQIRLVSWYGDPWPPKAQKQKLPGLLKAHA